MTIELAMLVSFTAMMFNIVAFWIISRMRSEQLELAKRTWGRLNHIEHTMVHNDLTVPSWDLPETENYKDPIKKFKQEGNVVFMRQEEE